MLNIITNWFESLSIVTLISLGLNLVMILLFYIFVKIGKFSNEFIEARTIENSKIHYRIETYKTKFNEWLYKVIDKDKDKIVYRSNKFHSKLNLDREILRKYENLDEVVGIPQQTYQAPAPVQPLHNETPISSKPPIAGF